MARCPKCRCGGLVEIGRRMVCLNCDYTCSRTHARLLQDGGHTHSKVSYTKEVQIPRILPGKSASGYVSPAAARRSAALGETGKPPAQEKPKVNMYVAWILVVLFLFLILFLTFLSRYLLN